LDGFATVAIAAPRDVEGLVTTVEDANRTERIPFAQAEARAAQGAWIAVEIDHFSERPSARRTSPSRSRAPVPASDPGTSTATRSTRTRTATGSSASPT
jgi:hypothetical protein